MTLNNRLQMMQDRKLALEKQSAEHVVHGRRLRRVRFALEDLLKDAEVTPLHSLFTHD